MNLNDNIFNDTLKSPILKNSKDLTKNITTEKECKGNKRWKMTESASTKERIQFLSQV